MKPILLAAAIAFAASATPAYSTLPDSTKPCVAWAASKRMFLFKTLTPVGVNCAVTLKAVPEGSARRLRVTVPLASFDSEEPERDKKVLEILKSAVEPDLVFLSMPYGAKEWDDLRSGRASTIGGALRVGGAEFPVELSVVVSRGVALGKVSTSFSALNMEAPSVAGGLIAKVADELELRYRIPLSEVPR